MATEIVSNQVPKVLPPDLRPCVEHVVTEDDTPVDNVFSEKQQRLLTEPLHSSWGGAGEGRKFVALANVGLFYAVREPPFVPDMLLSLDVELPADVWPKAHRCYFVWEYGKPPDVVVEIVSNKEGGENTDKQIGYARIGVPYYVIYDPLRLLGDQPLLAYQLEAMRYRPLNEPLWLAGVELGLRLWQGRYEDHHNTWLRWVDGEGMPIPTGAERAEQQQYRADRERERAEQERVRAEQERVRADRERERAEQQRQRAEHLAEQLRRLGAEPEA